VGVLVLLTALAAGTPLGWAGWAAGGAVAGGTVALLLGGLRRSGATALGVANRVTLGRAMLVAGVSALVAAGVPAPPGLLAPVAGVALLLDAVDGRVARRTGSVSSLGARFDMEVDAFLILVLSIDVVPVVGGWVLGLGLARYALGGAALLIPWLRRPVPPSRWRKLVAAIQGVALAVVATEVLSREAAALLLGGAGLLLAQSFLSQVAWLARHGATRPVVVPEPVAVPRA
jgi:phosphatidylglycerophosphate synthase